MTWRLARHQRALEPRERDVLAHMLLRGNGQRYHLLAFVVMDDHIHVIARAGSWTLERSVDSWMSSGEQQLQMISGRRGRMWQAEVLRLAVRTDDQLRTLEYYVIGNPWKRWPFLRAYPWVWEQSPREDAS